MSFFKSKEQITNCIIRILNILVCIGIYNYIYPELYNICIVQESAILPFISQVSSIPIDSFWQMFTASDHNWYLDSALGVFAAKIFPQMVKLHPQDAYPIIGTKIVFINFLLLLFAISNSFLKYTKTKYLYPVVITAVFFTVPYLLRDITQFCYFDNPYWSDSYILATALVFFLLNYCEKWFITGEKLTKLNIGIIIILLCGIAVFHEFMKFNVLATAIIAYCLALIFKKIKFNIKDFIGSALIFLSVCFLFSLNLISHTFSKWFLSHLSLTPANHSDYMAFLNSYFQSFISEIIKPDTFLIVTIIILTVCICLFVKDKEKNKKIFIINGAFLLSMILFLIIAVIAGDNYEGTRTMITQHQGIKTVIALNLLYITFSLGGYLFSFSEKISEKSKNIISLIIFFTVLISLNTFMKEKHKYINTIMHTNAQNIKTNMYILEKTYVLNKRYGKPDTFISYNHWWIFSDDDLNYIYYYYEPGKFRTTSDVEKHKSNTNIIHVCKNDDYNETCKKNMIETVKKELGYAFTDKELQELDFAGLFRLNKELNGIENYYTKQN